MVDLDAGLCLPSEFLGGLNIPHLEQYFGVWAVAEDPFRAMVDRVSKIDLRVHVADTQAELEARGPGGDDSARPFQLAKGGLAIVSIQGTMTKYGSSLSSAGSTIRIRRAVRAAVADEEVAKILLVIDSPGGTVAGTRDLADDVAAAALAKPVIAYIEDLGASAAYWVASQARTIYANPTAMVGSIGTYAAIQDLSGAAAQLGIKVHVIRAGEFKGAGTPGTEITRAQLDEWQRVINELNEHFVSAVASGRRLNVSRVRELADGRVHLADPAVALGLIDRVQSLDDTLTQLSRKERRSTAMSEKTNDTTPAASQPAPTAATYAQIKAACPGADAPFLCSQMERSATVDQARSAWMEEQGRQLAAMRTELDQAKAAQAAQKQVPGVEPIGTAAASKLAPEGDPIAAWEDMVDGYAKSCGDRGKAISKAVRANPEAHRDYLVAFNAARGRPCNR